MSPSERKQASVQILTALRRTPSFRDALEIEVSRLDEDSRDLLASNRYISPSLAEGAPDQWVAIARSGGLSAFLMEEDHLRIQAVTAGSQMVEAAQRALDAAKEVESAIPLAFDPQIGWLTSSILNSGSGLRASVLMHLAGLQTAYQLEGELEQLTREGFSVRGLYGEGTTSPGALVQISNSTGFNLPVWAAIQQVNVVQERLAKRELQARKQGFDNGRYLTDKWDKAIHRLMTSDPTPSELIAMVSDLRLALATSPENITRDLAAEWVALVGALRRSVEPQQERFLAVRQAARLRHRVRAWIEGEASLSS